MSFAVLCLVVSAAFAHAGWNFVAKGAEGGAAFVWMSLVAGSLIYVPALIAALAIAPGPLGWAALGLMAGSGVLHAVYFTLLQRGYATGDLSVVYPLARGTGPLLSTAAGIVLLDEHPGAAAIAGAATIVMAIFLLASPGTASRAAIVFAVLTGVAIPRRTRSGTSRPSTRPRWRRSSLLLGHEHDRRPAPHAVGRAAAATTCGWRGRRRAAARCTSGC